MSRMAKLIVACSMMMVSLAGREASAQYLEEETIRAATGVLTETMATPGSGIPQSMLSGAHGVAIIPNVIKGGFVVGARHGRGVLFLRDESGPWHAPVFVTLTGGNVGWQVGVQSSDIILVFKTAKSVQGILSGKMTLGADAAAAAGPVGRQAAAATDGRLAAEIYTYSRSRGLFAGVSIDGSVLRMDQFATSAYYRSPAPGQPVTVPPSAERLTQMIASYAQPNAVAPTPSSPNPAPSLIHYHSASEADVLRGQLVQLAPQLYEILDPKWREYLAMPPDLFLSGPHPSVGQLNETLRRFDTVVSSRQYQSLSARPEFQSVHGVLRHYQQSLVATPSTVDLPPPPLTTTSSNFVPR